jgi:hypothetical protein
MNTCIAARSATALFGPAESHARTCFLTASWTGELPSVRTVGGPPRIIRNQAQPFDRTRFREGTRPVPGLTARSIHRLTWCS